MPGRETFSEGDPKHVRPVTNADMTGILARAALIMAFISSGLTACGGMVVVDTDPNGAAPPSGAGAPSSPTGDGSTPPPDGTSTQAECSYAHSALDSSLGVDDVSRRLTGRWIPCSSWADVLTKMRTGGPAVGMEFTEDGHFYWLIHDESSQIVRGQGLIGAATYKVQPSPHADGGYEIAMAYADGLELDLRATFETSSPRRLGLSADSAVDYFVPF